MGDGDAYGHDRDVLRESISHRLGGRCGWLIASASRSALLAALFDGMPAMIVAALGGTPVEVADIRSLSAETTTLDMLVVDVSATTTYGCPALRLGADVAFAQLADQVFVLDVSRTSKKAGLSGVVHRIAELPAPTNEQLQSACLADAHAHGRWHKTSDAAAVLARYLACHPAVGRVRYPGLRGDPCFDVAARTLNGGFGPIVSYATSDAPDVWTNYEATALDPREQVMSFERALSRRL